MAIFIGAFAMELINSTGNTDPNARPTPNIHPRYSLTYTSFHQHQHTTPRFKVTYYLSDETRTTLRGQQWQALYEDVELAHLKKLKEDCYTGHWSQREETCEKLAATSRRLVARSDGYDLEHSDEYPHVYTTRKLGRRYFVSDVAHRNLDRLRQHSFERIVDDRHIKRLEEECSTGKRKISCDQLSVARTKLQPAAKPLTKTSSLPTTENRKDDQAYSLEYSAKTFQHGFDSPGLKRRFFLRSKDIPEDELLKIGQSVEKEYLDSLKVNCLNAAEKLDDKRQAQSCEKLTKARNNLDAIERKKFVAKSGKEKENVPPMAEKYEKDPERNVDTEGFSLEEVGIYKRPYTTRKLERRFFLSNDAHEGLTGVQKRTIENLVEHDYIKRLQQFCLQSALHGGDEVAGRSGQTAACRRLATATEKLARK